MLNITSAFRDMSLAVAAFTVFAGTASAGAIYQDTFPANASTALNGTTPARHHTGVTWIAIGWKADGSVNDTTSLGKAFLPITPVTGATYALAARNSIAPPPMVRGFNSSSLPFKDNMFPYRPGYFRDARGWGANVMRLQLHPVRYAVYRHEKLWQAWPSFLNLLVAQIQRARRAGLKVVLDMHGLPFDLPGATTSSARSAVAGKFRGSAAFWKKPDLARRFCHIWSDIAEKTAPLRSSIYGYDLFNEPRLDNKPGKASISPPWRPLAIKIIKAIRKVDKKTWIIYEVAPWDLPRGFVNLSPLRDPRIIYSVHFYDPQGFTMQGLPKYPEAGSVHYPGLISPWPNSARQMWDKQMMLRDLAPVIDFQKKYHVPIYVGEFSVICWAPQKSAARWLTDAISIFERFHWSWTYHDFGHWHGWDLCYSGQTKSGLPRLARHETVRAKVVRAALAKNWKH